MKKIIVPIIATIIIFSITPFASANSKAIVKETAVRMRSEKSTDSEIVTVIYEDDECELLQDDGEWIQIKYKNDTGYAKKEFFNIKQDESNESNETVVNNVNNTTISNNTNEISNTTNTLANNSVVDSIVQNQINEISTTIEQNMENIIEKTITINDTYTLTNNTDLRSIPSLTAKNNVIIPLGTQIIVKASFNNWYKISDGTNTGWITKTKLNIALSENKVDTESKVDTNQKTEEKKDNEVKKEDQTKENETTNNVPATTTRTGAINVDTARVREKPSTDSEIIGTLDEDEIINIIGEEGDFYKFTTPSISGYVSKKLVTEKKVTSRSTTETRENTENIDNTEDTVPENINDKLNDALKPDNHTENSATGNAIVEYAKQYLGYPYVSGKRTPAEGFDCSGFTQYVFGNFDVKLGATAASQSNAGTEIARENLQTGDLLIFYDEGMSKIGHVGIYIENGEFIHSANPQRGVVTDNINTNSYYNKRYITARRLIN